jgi:hypothetical protein
MPRKAAGKDVAKKEANTGVAVYDYGDDAGAGFENMGRESFAVPFLYLLQANSPIIAKGENDEAKAGFIMNTVDQSLFPAIKAKDQPGILFVPCYHEHLFVEWKPIDEGGGFIGQHAPDSQLVLDMKNSNQPFGKWKTSEGNELVDTFYLYGNQVLEGGECVPSIIAFNSTKIKIYRQWMTRAKSMRIPTPGGGKIIPPLYAHVWRIQTIMQAKDSYNFYNFEVSFSGDSAAESRLAPDNPIFVESKNFYELCKEGAVRAATESLQREAGDDNVGEDKEIPF